MEQPFPSSEGVARFLNHSYAVSGIIQGRLFMLLRDRTKHLQNTSIIIYAVILSGCACLWFGGIACLYIFMNIFIVPTLSRLEIPAHELRLPAAPANTDKIYLLGLKMGHPVQGLTADAIVPFFKNHSLESVSVFLNNGKTHAGNIVIYRYPDDMNIRCGFDLIRTHKTLHSIILFNSSRFDLIDKMNRADMSGFSWWNLFHDIRLVYVLFYKAIFTPIYCEGGSLYHLKTDYFTGYLYSGKYGKDKNGKVKYVKDLWFAEDGYLFNIIFLDKNNKNINNFLSNITVASEYEAEAIINDYKNRAVSEDIVSASRLSRKVTIEDLENIIVLTEQHKAAGDRTANSDLNKELLYLKGINK